MFVDRFNALILKINFKKYKNIIWMYFLVKNTSKNNCYHNTKHALKKNPIEIWK